MKFRPRLRAVINAIKAAYALNGEHLFTDLRDRIYPGEWHPRLPRLTGEYFGSLQGAERRRSRTAVLESLGWKRLWFSVPKEWPLPRRIRRPSRMGIRIDPSRGRVERPVEWCCCPRAVSGPNAFGIYTRRKP